MLAVALLGACYGDADRFNERQAGLLCRLQEKCTDVDFGVGAANGQSCETNRVEELSQCTAACDYDPDAARRCIRGIKKALPPNFFGDGCDFEDATLDACAEVYTNCTPTFDDEPELSCDVPPPELLGCAVAGTTATPWPLVVIALGARRRRLRRP